MGNHPKNDLEVAQAINQLYTIVLFVGIASFSLVAVLYCILLVLLELKCVLHELKPCLLDWVIVITLYSAFAFFAKVYMLEVSIYPGSGNDMV